MRELSLHILDIVQNSIAAEAKNIYIEIYEESSSNIFRITITDDGKGMDEETLNRVNNSFISSRTTRKIGMGIAIFRAAAEIAGGSLVVRSSPGKGTTVTAAFERNNVDRMPLGDIAETIIVLIMRAKDIEYTYHHIYNGRDFIFSTNNIKEIIEDLPIDNYEILQYIKKYINENLMELGVD
jgi:hypothetical protein